MVLLGACLFIIEITLKYHADNSSWFNDRHFAALNVVLACALQNVFHIFMLSASLPLRAITH